MRLAAGTVGYGACPGAWAGRGSFTHSVYAAREFETSDPDFADVLFRIQYLAARMP
jgi:hypothetical protein